MNTVPISITINACTSPIYIKLTNSFNSNNTYFGKYSLRKKNLLPFLTNFIFLNNFLEKTVITETITNEMKTVTYTSVKGYFKLNVTATDNDTYIHVYLSTEPGGPEALKNIDKFINNVKLIKKQRKKHLTVRWEPRFVYLFVLLVCAFKKKMLLTLT